MGVHGLWKLLQSTGKPINPETLEGKILAVDISIWLNQAVKGVRDRDGNNVHNAHLLTLFHRLCKLLFFRIRPVFVYDGDAPLLKRQTLAVRRQRKEEMALESKQTREKLLRTFLKRQAIKAALGDRSQETIPSISSARRDEVDEMYALPALPPAEEEERSSSDEEPERDEAQTQEPSHTFQDEIYDDPNSVDINSEDFHLLSPEIKHEILKDMKEFSKRRRTLFHKPPEKSGDFSQYQLAGLLQRNNLNQRLEGVEKEMSQRRCGAVEEEYGQSDEHDVESRRLLSEDSSHYILVKGSRKSSEASESHPAPDPWSCGSWSRKGKLQGRPEPLWRPVSDGIREENEPTSSSSSSTTPKPIICSEEQPSDGAPPSPRTLRAIQAAMMDSSSDEDELASKKMIRDGCGKVSSRDGNGGVSPRTLQAIQRALMEDNNVSEDLCRAVQSQQKKYVIVSSSDDDDDQTESTVVERSILGEAREAGGVSPQTLLGLQRALGEKESFTGIKQVEHVGFLSSSEGEEMEEAVGVRSKEFKAATHTKEEEHAKGALKTAFSPSPLQPDQDNLPQDHESSCNSENNFLQKGSLNVNLTEETEGRNGPMIVKSEEEDSSSEGFVEVSEGEEVSESDNSGTKSEERLAEMSNKEEVVGSDEEESQENESSDGSLSLNTRTVEEQEPGSSREAAAVPAPSEWDNIDMEELVQLEKNLQAEQSSLRGQQQQQQRSAATVTGQMCQESQELLRLFGVPFIVAPMEAEAQCATLDRTDQTHGTITDDSDVWLFGGRHVYKNFFSSNKYVEHYQYLDIQNQLGLDRTKLINLAYLLGSDYTEGIPGVGYVTGMEILNEFPGPGLEPLTQFSKWWNEAQTSKKLAADPKHTKVKKKLKGLSLHAGFPNPAVAEAYLQPTVDQSESSFCWGRPQLDLLKEFCYSRFGWNSRKTEETLQPVLKQLSTQQTQLRIDSFFRLEQQERQAIQSQRLRRAVTCLKRKERDGADNEAESSEDEKVSPVKKGKNAKEKGTDVTPAGMFGGGFIGLDMSSNRPEEKVIVDEVEKQPKTVKSELLKAQSNSSSSSSSEDELEHKNRATMITAQSVFEGKTRGRGRRGGRGKTKKNF
ncbi:DNA excision repair protein ERCC-5 [Ictalurus punctatus]|uniref:DNA excision repair protein ERCC-5 n=1 Tax=Ictalurus punctatus TaxID=7998 RepID=A0A9F7TGR5_ICTPU|nr:DNA excision repair protein ERCC-5 [Ictalurus punctatus]XP_053532354.1 DNA excision repair protein ERCC-5 [Ictalurus punctatus]